MANTDTNASASKTILLTGATGKQGRAFIAALAPPAPPPNDHDTDAASPFHILALTRDPSSPSARSLASQSNVTLVKADLNDPASVRGAFELAKGEYGGVWGVFCVLAFPGLGDDGAGEERQGKTIADLALEFAVSTFVYSSAERGGESADDSRQGSGRAKVAIERHVKGLGEKGLRWTILRPGFFMENFEGRIGSITTAVLQCGLKPTTQVQLIAADDIGRTAAGVFQDPDAYACKVLAVIGDFLSMPEQAAAYKHATGRARPAIPAFLARILMTLNTHTRGIVADIERVQKARTEGAVPDLDVQIALAKKAYPGMRTFEQWAADAKARQVQGDSWKGNWNQVSLLRLVTGKS
ncbi:NAD(P)-binding protein [Dentipellis sp. KUC8613]|nr:NAD(P)-binding protein [Dentipellis sp. KUC8613]